MDSALLAASPWFRWIPGMLARSPGGIPIRVITGAGPVPAEAPAWGVDDVGCEWRIEDVILDLTDPATFGCLLALVRERYGAPCAVAVPVQTRTGGVLTVTRWRVYPNVEMDEDGFDGPSEAEALIAALEAPRV